MESYRYLGELHLTDELEYNENFDIELHFYGFHNKKVNFLSLYEVKVKFKVIYWEKMILILNWN